jgi:hypothetical protein
MVGKTKELIRWLLEQDEEKKWKITAYNPKRSLNANAYYHKLCQLIAEATQQKIIEVKNQTLADYGQIDTETGIVILRDDIDWKSIPYMHLLPTSATRTLDDNKLYRVYRVIRGSHTYDTKEMSRLIEGTVMEAKELDIETMTPDQLKRMVASWKPRREDETI